MSKAPCNACTYQPGLKSWSVFHSLDRRLEPLSLKACRSKINRCAQQDRQYPQDHKHRHQEDRGPKKDPDIHNNEAYKYKAQRKRSDFVDFTRVFGHIHPPVSNIAYQRCVIL